MDETSHHTEAIELIDQILEMHEQEQNCRVANCPNDCCTLCLASWTRTHVNMETWPCSTYQAAARAKQALGG